MIQETLSAADLKSVSHLVDVTSWVGLPGVVRAQLLAEVYAAGP